MHLKIIKPFFTNTKSIVAIRATLDTIESRELGYRDYAQRTGLIWSDVLANTISPINILKEYNTQKMTLVDNIPTVQHPQSLLKYAALKSIVCSQMLPKMFEVVSEWTQLPDHVYVQVFFQRCSSSEFMNWHQDPGEYYDLQAHYSMVLMLSKKDDPEYGWGGGLFKIRSGLPTDTTNEPIRSIMLQYNQAIVFDNRANSHSVTEIVPINKTAIRDLAIITIFKE